MNYHLVDRFTLAHAVIGITYSLLGLELLVTCVLAVAWELIENPMKAYLPRIFPHATRDTLRNAVGDMLAVLGGWGAIQFAT